MENLQRVIKAYAPILYIRTSEEHVPTGIDWYVKRCRLSNESTGLFTTNVTLASLPVGTESEECRLELKNKSDRKGDLSQAKAYVKVQEVGQHVEVQFWFFYGYSYPVTAKLTNVTASKRPIEIPLLGEMEGRWHSVSICFGNADLTTPLYVRTKNEMKKFVDCHKDGDRVHVYSSATFGLSFDMEEKTVSMHRNIIGDQIRVELVTDPLSNNDSSILGVQTLDCSNRYEIVDATLLGDDTHVVPSWTKFDGKVGTAGGDSLRTSSTTPLSSSIRETVQKYVNPWPEHLPRIIKPKAGNIGTRPPFGHRIMMTNISDLLVHIAEEANEDPHAPIAEPHSGQVA